MPNLLAAAPHIVLAASKTHNVVKSVTAITHTSFYNSGAPLLLALGALVVLAIWPRKRRG